MEKLTDFSADELHLGKNFLRDEFTSSALEYHNSKYTFKLSGGGFNYNANLPWEHSTKILQQPKHNK